jgi:hypothetical protein
MTTLTTSKPYMVGPGNHKSDCDNGRTTDSSKNVMYTESICMPGQTVSISFVASHLRRYSATSAYSLRTLNAIETISACHLLNLVEPEISGTRSITEWLITCS